MFSPRMGTALGLGLFLAAGSVAWTVWRNLPDLAAPPIAGLSAPVAVALDGRGVATLQAGTWSDLIRVQGYLAARERLFLMDLMRRKADGRLAELVGASQLPSDRLHRIYGFRAVAEREVAALPPEEREDLEAYADGINAFITSHAGRWGVEFRLLGSRPEPWTPADSLKLLLLLNEDLGTSWRRELQSRALEALPATTRGFLQPRFAPQDAPLWADAAPPVLETEVFFRTPRVQPRAVAALDPDPGLPLPSPEAREASNAWAIAGGLTRSGRPLLANDPHLDLYLPGLWLTFRLEWAGRWAQGAGLPGLPGIVMGGNDHCAWGLTNLGTDVQDLYQEPATGSRVERIRVKGAPSQDLVVALGAHGPQVQPGLSLAWTALQPGNLRMPARALDHATDWGSFNRAADEWLGPAMNMVYADAAGHIGWRATGRIPLRVRGDDGSRIHQDGAGTWLGTVSAQAMPRVLDPPEGFLATANNRTIGNSFPNVITTEWVGTSRVSRIRALLAGARDWTPRAVEGMQRDTLSPFHEAFRAAMGPVLKPGASFTQVELLRRAFRRRLAANLLTGSTLTPDHYAWEGEDAWVLAAARATPDQWRLAGLGDKGAFLEACLLEARGSRDWGRPWEEVNELRIRHPFGVKGGFLGWLFNPPVLHVPGSARAIRVVNGIHAQSLRMVVDCSDLEATRMVLPLGESGHLGSPHRLDQSRDWVAGDPDGTRTRLHQPALARLVFQPGARP